MPSQRDDFKAQDKETLALRVSHRCSNPKCRRPTSGPSAEPTKAHRAGKAAHIAAAASGGPRFDAEMTAAERSSVLNGIWLCDMCARMVDDDRTRYSADVLRDWKRTAEDEAHQAVSTYFPPFQIQVEDQCFYINIPRISQLLGPVDMNKLTNVWDGGDLLEQGASTARLIYEANELVYRTLLRAINLEEVAKLPPTDRVGHLLQFDTKLHSRNSPKPDRKDRFQIVPSGDLERDHYVYADVSELRMILPITWKWICTTTGIVMLIGRHKRIKGIAYVIDAPDAKTVVASPWWLGLPGRNWLKKT
jgi:hypothetical protein